MKICLNKDKKLLFVCNDRNKQLLNSKEFKNATMDKLFELQDKNPKYTTHYRVYKDLRTWTNNR